MRLIASLKTHNTLEATSYPNIDCVKAPLVANLGGVVAKALSVLRPSLHLSFFASSSQSMPKHGKGKR